LSAAKYGEPHLGLELPSQSNFTNQLSPATAGNATVKWLEDSLNDDS